jgi:hypothetical protein
MNMESEKLGKILWSAPHTISSKPARQAFRGGGKTSKIDFWLLVVIKD